MKTVVLLSVMICSISISFTQNETIVIDRKFRFGFNLGANYSILLPKEKLVDTAKITNGIGFSLGVLMDYRINNRFLISPKAELSFNNSNINFTLSDNSNYRYKIFPMSLNFK